MKASETPQEKRLRRVAKKEAKERRRREKEGWDKDYLVCLPTDYTYQACFVITMGLIQKGGNPGIPPPP